MTCNVRGNRRIYLKQFLKSQQPASILYSNCEARLDLLKQILVCLCSRSAFTAPTRYSDPATSTQASGPARTRARARASSAEGATSTMGQSDRPSARYVAGSRLRGLGTGVKAADAHRGRSVRSIGLDPLVGHDPEDQVHRPAGVRWGVQRRHQRRDPVLVVRPVEQQRRMPGDLLQPTGPAGPLEPGADGLRPDGEPLTLEQMRAGDGRRRRCDAGARREAPGRGRPARDRDRGSARARPARSRGPRRAAGRPPEPAQVSMAASASGRCSATTAGTPFRKMAAFSRAMASTVSPRYSTWSIPTRVTAVRRGRAAVVASRRPPRPTSSTAR